MLECKKKGIGGTKVAKEYGISRSQFFNWTKAYLNYGIKELENKKKPGNPLLKYSSKKNLTDIEKLQYEVKS